jgi:hypothetical protein
LEKRRRALLVTRRLRFAMQPSLRSSAGGRSPPDRYRGWMWASIPSGASVVCTITALFKSAKLCS